MPLSIGAGDDFQHSGSFTEKKKYRFAWKGLWQPRDLSVRHASSSDFETIYRNDFLSEWYCFSCLISKTNLPI